MHRSTLTALLLLTVGAAGSALAGDVTTIEGIPHVENGAEPSDGTRSIELEERWRAGGEDDEVFFGTIGRVLVDEDGNYYLMDAQLSEVQVYSPDGEHLRTLGREGDGPGEIRNPNDMFFMPDGNVGMVQTFPGKVVLIDREGNPAGSYNYNAGDPSQGQFAVLITSRCRGGNIVLGGIRMSFSQGGVSDQNYFLARCDTGGAEQHRYHTKQHQINYANLVMDEEKLDFPWGRLALGPDGRVYIGPERNAYRVHVYSPEGELQRVIERDYQHWQRTAEQREEARLTIEAVGRNYPAPVQEIITLDTEPDIESMRVDADHALWIQNSRDNRERRDGVMAIYDYFDADGHYRQKVELVAPGNPEQDAVFMLENQHVVVVRGLLDAFRSMQGVSAEEGEAAGGETDEEEEEDTPLEVICYAMPES
jgi:hypothetical protein